MNHKEPKKLDIDAVLKSKAKKHYNKIPKVAINYLKRKVHQDELNHIIPDLSPFNLVRFYMLDNQRL